MMSLARCRDCTGFVPPRALACPHCGAACILSQLARAAVALAAGSGLSMTLAACYGAPCTGGGDNDGDGAAGVDGSCGLAPADCNDADVAIFPGAPDPVGDGVDSDCDSVDGQLGVTVCAPDATDADGDGFAPTGVACFASELDCNDADFDEHPGAVDSRNDGVDANCDGVDGNRDCVIGTIDGDQDGSFADGTCDPADCDDADATRHPRASDQVGNGVDENCDEVDGTRGSAACDPLATDADGDGYVESSEVCAQLDCDDGEPLVHPDAIDNGGDGIDANCDGVDGVSACEQGTTDADGDGYASDGTCIPLDCNDAQSAIHPYAADGIGDGFDQDCDGVDG